MGAASRVVKKGKVDADQTANFHQSCKVCVDPVTDTAAMIVTPPQPLRMSHIFLTQN